MAANQPSDEAAEKSTGKPNSGIEFRNVCVENDSAGTFKAGICASESILGGGNGRNSNSGGRG